MPTFRLSLLSVRSVILFLGIAESLTVPCSSKEPWEDRREQTPLRRFHPQPQQPQPDDPRAQVERMTKSHKSAARTGGPPATSSPDRKIIVSGEVGAAFF